MDSLCGTTIGNIEIIEPIGKQSNGCSVYSVKCKMCAMDPDLHGLAVYSSTKSRLLSGSVPCACSKNYRWSDEQQALRIMRLGKVQTVTVRNGTASCTCDKGHSWTASAKIMVNNRTGCPDCNTDRKSKSYQSDRDAAVDLVSALCKSNSYVCHGHDDWIGSLTRIHLECANGHRWSPTYDNFVHTKTNCPGCAKSGYNPSIPGWFYVYVWEVGDVKFFKYGITSNPKRRLNQQKMLTNCTPTQLACVQFNDGNIPIEIERYISSIHSPAVSKDVFPDGYTETLSYEAEPFITRLITAITNPHFSLSDLPSIS